MFKDRMDAGKKLCDKLKHYKDDHPIILVIPRGGIEVAYESIKNYNFEWSFIIPRKIGAPHNKELAIGAVSSDGTYFVDEYYIDKLGITKEYIEHEVSVQINEIKRRMKEYNGNESFPDVSDRTVIIIDDGIATGFTILAAIKSIRNQGARKIIIATPVAPQDTVDKLCKTVEKVICLYIPLDFYAVGFYYEVFEQVTDKDMSKIIQKLRRYNYGL